MIERIAKIASALVALTLVSASADAPSLSPEARAELSTAVDELKSHHFNSTSVDWPAIEAKAYQPGFGRHGSRPRGGELVRSFTIITVGARGVLGDLHDRAPAIIGPENWDAWLGSEEVPNEDLIAMLIPIAAERLTMWPVSKALGNVKNEGPELVERVSSVD